MRIFVGQQMTVLHKEGAASMHPHRGCKPANTQYREGFDTLRFNY
jgi:hypothetical protein